MSDLLYLFERFPTFTQTFCVREVLQLQRLGLRPRLISIRDTRDEAIRHFPRELVDQVTYLPQGDALPEAVDQLKREGRLSKAALLTLRQWQGRADKRRVHEAIWIGAQLWHPASSASNDGNDPPPTGPPPLHVHTHFAGIAARTCWWLRRLYGIGYSFTGHANDLFSREPVASPVQLPQLMHDASLVVTVSDFSAGLLRERFPTAAGKVVRVYNGMDIEPFAAAARPPDQRQPGLIVGIGRLIEKKGYDDLIRACALLHGKGLDLQCEIIGDGPLEADLRQQIDGAGLQKVVHLIGPRSQEQIRHTLGARASIFALPCVVEKDGGMDNLPTVIMEAMAAALPCVSTRLAGVPEMVIHERTGLLSQPRQPEDFARLLQRLLENPDAARAMGAAGQRHAREQFAQEVTAGQLLNLFRRRATLRWRADLWRSPQQWSALPAQLLRRTSAAVRQRPPKVRDKSFDLDRFMFGR